MILTFSCRSAVDKFQSKEIVIGQFGEKIDDYLSGLEPFGLSGSFLVAENDTIVFHKAYGLANRDELVENTNNTLFSTGSITKQFTATAILKLEEEGLLDTSDPISLFLENVPSDKRTITIHHLLTHTSGLPVIVSKDDFDPITREEFIERLMNNPLAFQPGSDFLYSNSAYGLLAIIIENLSGKTYDKFLATELFSLADVSTIGYDVAIWENMEEAHNYLDDRDYGTFQERNYPNWNLIGNGGLLTTSMDLYKWMSVLKSDRLISELSRKKLFTPFLEDFAYGWEVYDDNGQMIEHTGSGDGNNSLVQWFVGKDILFIGLSNYSFDGKDLLDYLYDDIFALVHHKEIQSLPNVDLDLIGSIDSSQIGAGTYRFDSTSHISIQPFGMGFRIRTIGQEARNLFEHGEEYIPHLYDAKNKTAFESFQLAIEKDDFSGFRKLIDNEKRISRIRKFLMSFIQDLGFEDPKVLPYISERNEDGLQSYVTISDGKKVINKNKRYPFLSIVWKEDDTYLGIGSITQVPRNPSYYFVKNAANGFVGFNWNTKKVRNIFMESSKEKSNKIKINVEGRNEFELDKF